MPVVLIQVHAYLISTTSILASWNWGGPGPPTLDHFLVERSPDGFTYTTLGTVGNTVFSYLDTGLTPGTQYWYRVTGKDSSSSSIGLPGSDSATTPSLAHTRWIQQTLSGYLGTVQWLRICYGSSLFVAMGKDPTTGGLVIATSTDTITWTQATGSFTAPYNTCSGADITFGNGHFLIVGTDIYGTYNAGNTTFPQCVSASGTSGWATSTPAIGSLNSTGTSPQPGWVHFADFGAMIIYVIDNTLGGVYCGSTDSGTTWTVDSGAIGDHTATKNFGGFAYESFSALVVKAEGTVYNLSNSTHQALNASGGLVRESICYDAVGRWATIDPGHATSALWQCSGTTSPTTWTAVTGPVDAQIPSSTPPTLVEFLGDSNFYYSLGPDNNGQYRTFSSPDLSTWTEELSSPAPFATGQFVGIADNGAGKFATFSRSTPGLMAYVGSSTATVPNVVGDVLATGETAIVAAGLTVGTVTTGASLTVPPGDIISTTPAAATVVASGSAVAILESSGVAVPNVVNELLSAAMADIVAAGLTVGAVTTSTSISIVAGNIISSTPAAATQVAGGSSVALLDSIGLPTETIPNVVGEVLATGEAALVAAGLVTGTVTTSTSITIASGSIISQSLLGTALYGTAIDLVESTGLPTVPVPNVVGMPLATASATLVAAGFVSGTVTTATSITIPGGDIISQSVTGTALYGTTVNMVESSGLPTVSVPNVVGDTVAVATAALVAANLVLGVVSTGYSATIPNGEIMSQDVTGTALYGTPVDLVLSLGPPLIFPPVIGETVAAATVTLTGLGLTLGDVIEGVSEDFPIGIIYAYSPPGGVEPASTVDLFVSSLYLSQNGAKYASLITSEHNQKPKYMALVTFLCSVMADITAACAAIPAAFDLDLAVGNQLDIIGLWVGQPRVIQSILITGFFGFADDVEALPFGELTDPSKGGRWYELNEASTGTATLGDTAYRTLLKARIIRNQSDGTTPEIEASLLDIFGAPCAITDAGTLSLAITVPVPITPEEEALVGPLDLLPRPAGVAIGSITYTG